jgi:hypothetical protein
MLKLASEDDLAGPGALDLATDGVSEVRHVVGAIAWPTGEPVGEIRVSGDAVEVLGEGGTERRLPFWAGYLGEAG